jgi:UDP-N-acetylglucosamine--N-acetylmuramyl-(pentapeptide) pyrophosphoryl-undecaprenol N-acetylglucosamine transferase
VGRTALLVAGGTGGHLFPALALRETLMSRGFSVSLATDPRAEAFVVGVPSSDQYNIRSATVGSLAPGQIWRSTREMSGGLIESHRLLRKLRPSIVIGFGGYPTVPPLIAARLAGVPTLVHEQNAVVGRANRLLIRLGATLASGFADPQGGKIAKRRVHVGNPVRAAIAAAAQPYAPPELGGHFRLLVVGGSQGARVFSTLIPAALALLKPEQRRRVRLTQQARSEDLAATAAALKAIAVEATLSPFFADMGKRLAEAHLVISRAGASTVAELAALGRPAILVPYPHALDHDQAENARFLQRVGGCWLMPEAELSVDVLAKRLAALMDWPDELARAAAAAKAEGRLDAAERLADLIEALARD